MKILFLTAWYPTKENPVLGIFVQEHAKAVSISGDEIIVLYGESAKTHIKGFYQFSDSMEQGIRTIRISYYHSPFRPISYLIYLWSLVRVSQRLFRMGLKPEVIHAHVYLAGVPAVIIGKLYGIPVVISEHWSKFPRRNLRWVEKNIAKFTFRWAKMVLPVSFALQKAIESYGIQARFRIVPNTVDTSVFYSSSHFRNRSHPKRILFVGLLVPVKGIPYLLKAVAQLRRQRDDWHLEIVGDGPKRPEYMNLATTLGIADKVTFSGLKSKLEVAEVMRETDFFVLPSLWENSPCVLLEAMASGLPIVSTAVGGIPEMIDRETGILVPPSNAKQLCNAIATMMELLDRFDRSGIVKKIDQYRPEIVGGLIHSVYENCIRR